MRNLIRRFVLIKIQRLSLKWHFLYFYNQGNVNVYYKYEKFDFDPFNIKASSTSGSPVVLTQGGFFGFLNDMGGRFSHDGKGKLIMTIRITMKKSDGFDLKCASWYKNYLAKQFRFHFQYSAGNIEKEFVDRACYSDIWG